MGQTNKGYLILTAPHLRESQQEPIGYHIFDGWLFGLSNDPRTETITRFRISYALSGSGAFFARWTLN